MSVMTSPSLGNIVCRDGNAELNPSKESELNEIWQFLHILAFIAIELFAMEFPGRRCWGIAAIPFVVIMLMGCQTHGRIELRRQRFRMQSPSILGLPAEKSSPYSPPTPQVYFEVCRPIRLPAQNSCSVLVLQHEFGYTYGKPPVVVEYRPPAQCPQKWSMVVMEWKATCKGKQFDRIAGVWLGGVEILRTCTAEPIPAGIEWAVQKDITKYSALLQSRQNLTVKLDNLVDSTYTGVYHVNITFHFYEDHGEGSSPSPGPADLILPISQPLLQNGGCWFQIKNPSDIQSRRLQIPPNAYRAVLEIFISFHSEDEFWYSNPPNVYIEANHLNGTAGNGPFREVVALVDGVAVGAVWPFPVIYTGGINPLFWRPVAGIGQFDLPSYDLEVTPFLGKLLDSKQHNFGFSVTNGLSVWFIDANLHLWLDKKSATTTGQLIEYKAPPYTVSLVADFKQLDGSFNTSAERVISYSGWVESSHGKLITHFSQDFKYENLMKFENSGNVQVVQQRIWVNSGIVVEMPAEVVLSAKVFTYFPLYAYTLDVPKGKGAYTEKENISNAFNMDVSIVAPAGSFFSSLHNSQDAHGYMTVKNHQVSSGLGSTQQTYGYRSTEGCYNRKLSVSNYTFLSDYADDVCGSTAQSSE